MATRVAVILLYFDQEYHFMIDQTLALISLYRCEKDEVIKRKSERKSEQLTQATLVLCDAECY